MGPAAFQAEYTFTPLNHDSSGNGLNQINDKGSKK